MLIWRPPFFFVFNTAMIGNGELDEIAIVLSTASVGIVLIAAGLQGHLVGLGSIDGNPFLAWPGRVFLVFAGIIFAVPGNPLLGFSHVELLMAGIGLLLVGLPLSWVGRRSLDGTT